MGLAAPKNRARISNDPQNTTWANNTTRFGHRILASQGWKPGSSLGAADAAHAEHYTVASHSHIRVFLKDDNLGLGAKRGSERPENFGLAGLNSVLGRLNGREAEVKQEEERAAQIESRRHVVSKYGMMNFVSGGFLVGDSIKKRGEIKTEELEVKMECKEESDASAAEQKKASKRKRKRGEVDLKAEQVTDQEPKLKRKKKSMNLRVAVAEEVAVEEVSSKSTSRNEKKVKQRPETISSAQSELAASAQALVSEEPLSDKAKRKAEKQARREGKCLRKALKKAAEEAAHSQPASNKPNSDDEQAEESKPTAVAKIVAPTLGLGFSAGGRHAVRQRYIRSKKMAGMDAQALREIFMVKSA
ncbi:hypothetical protein BDV95DRAFT_625761 [Massariosphaeria phaeospora]|uniref:PinX1-related protein 1 n=1 Tax=Massariosphaeria phaeospora TaxID=100035 RepID=A0A7C8IH97_9PLEO|nr:hypothetical protein BDV95DRAFT_625761 [Massariosphaeria phaeospora]